MEVDKEKIDGLISDLINETVSPCLDTTAVIYSGVNYMGDDIQIHLTVTRDDIEFINEFGGADCCITDQVTALSQ